MSVLIVVMNFKYVQPILLHVYLSNTNKNKRKCIMYHQTKIFYGNGLAIPFFVMKSNQNLRLTDPTEYKMLLVLTSLYT